LRAHLASEADDDQRAPTEFETTTDAAELGRRKQDILVSVPDGATCMRTKRHAVIA